MPIVEFIVISVGILLLALWRFIPNSIFQFGVVKVSAENNARIVMAIVVSLAVLASALYVVLSGKYIGDSEKWAFGAIGTVVGYWLPGKST